MKVYLFLIAALILFGIPFGAHAADSSATLNTNTINKDAQQPVLQNVSLHKNSIHPVHDLIQEHLSAIRLRNDDAAFAKVNTKLRERYVDSESYLNALRFEYKPLYEHQHFTFTERHKIKNGYLQRVSIQRNLLGKEITVLYRIEEHGDGSLKIAAFSILQSESDPL